MEDRGPTLDRLVPYGKIGIWRPRFSGMTDKYGGLHCVLVDEKVNVIGHVVVIYLTAYNARETEALQTGKMVTIEELGPLDPDLYKDDTFLCKASIKRKSGEKVFGMPCKNLVYNQRSTDYKQLPSEFLRLT
ncbi:hypothetical protein D8674_010500 [Pyrus ussuriensis x Pyrus communis]|uniref:Uncharacterized protein n=1 Tax=Pyrus ussuriensis x Pyrus communis TaxID=2448454 RepID=A0A5N5FAX7_9ROSA|nr:hypothetical protein D8674_010500 [Pyrus ussuriensis x Pyrus communis]